MGPEWCKWRIGNSDYQLPCYRRWWHASVSAGIIITCQWGDQCIGNTDVELECIKRSNIVYRSMDGLNGLGLRNNERNNVYTDNRTWEFHII